MYIYRSMMICNMYMIIWIYFVNLSKWCFGILQFPNFEVFVAYHLKETNNTLSFPTNKLQLLMEYIDCGSAQASH